jgi:hypothetical protein
MKKQCHTWSNNTDAMNHHSQWHNVKKSYSNERDKKHESAFDKSYKRQLPFGKNKEQKK